jgi:hypothetical protein
MNQVLPFPIAASEKRRAPSGLACEIVIFPGVRIEYHDRRAVAEPRLGNAPRTSGRRGAK